MTSLFTCPTFSRVVEDLSQCPAAIPVNFTSLEIRRWDIYPSNISKQTNDLHKLLEIIKLKCSAALDFNRLKKTHGFSWSKQMLHDKLMIVTHCIAMFV